MNGNELRRRFLAFFEKRGHKIVPSSSLIPTDSSVLLTTAGMQQFKTYFVGAPPAAEWGRNVASVQKCFRTSDIDEVGDESHLTFFEMLGNFSFGGYGKREAIKFAHEFLVKELGLKIDYVTVFAGDVEISEDREAAEAWRALGVDDVRKAGREDNFWGPTGKEGPCGPTTEIYIRGVEIWNIVFNEYYRHIDGRREKLKTLGIDTGMGLERLAMIVQNKPTIFETDLFAPLMTTIGESSEIQDRRSMRIVADHVRAAVFLIADGIAPSNKDRGYILRRLLRRAQYFFDRRLGGKVTILVPAQSVLDLYKDTDYQFHKDTIAKVFTEEEARFAASLLFGERLVSKIVKERGFLSSEDAFSLFSTHGFPLEMTMEMAKERGVSLSQEALEKAFEKHQQISRAGAAGQFAGGLADHEPATIRLHTAHHLLLAALKRVLGPHVKQRGSNITRERLRLDFVHPERLTERQKKQVEEIVNEKIKEDLPVIRRELPREEAERLGAEMEFDQKYGETVSVYFIDDFSKEFCGGPHASRTGELGRFRIVKEEAVAAGVRRIKGTLD